MHRKSFLEPTCWFDRLVYAALVGLLPQLVIKRSDDDFSLAILLFWWVVVTYYTVTFVYRITNVLIRLWLRGFFRK